MSDNERITISFSRRDLLLVLGTAGLGFGAERVIKTLSRGKKDALSPEPQDQGGYKVVTEATATSEGYKIVTRKYHIVAQVDLKKAPQEVKGLQGMEYKTISVSDQEQLRNVLTGFKFAGTEDASTNAVLAERVLYLIPIFLQAEIETGIDWKIFMAIIGLENSFNVVNPNVDGIFQVTLAGGRDRDFVTGQECSRDDILDQCRWVVSIIEEHAQRANNKLNAGIVPVNFGGRSYLIAHNPNLTMDQLGKFAYAYNGIAYGADFCNSGYVAVKAQHCGNPAGMNVSDGRGGHVYMQRVGFLGILERLNSIDANIRELFSDHQSGRKVTQEVKTGQRPTTMEELQAKHHFVDQRLLVPTAKYLSGQPRDLKNPIGILWHYSVDPLKYSPDQRDGIRLVEYTVEERGWDRPPYHFYVGVDGTIYWIYDVDRQAYHAGSVYNPTHLAVSYVDIEEMGRVPNTKQLEAMKDISNVLIHMFSISPCKVQGHYEVEGSKHDPAGVDMVATRRELGCR